MSERTTLSVNTALTVSFLLIHGYLSVCHRIRGLNFSKWPGFWPTLYKNMLLSMKEDQSDDKEAGGVKKCWNGPGSTN